MAERVNIDLELVQNGGTGLYVADHRDDGILILEERPNDPVDADGGYVTFDDGYSTVLETRETEEMDAELVDVETGAVVDTVFAAEIGPRQIPVETLDDRNLVTLSLVS